jgi:UDP-glucuronate decarboxylase
MDYHRQSRVNARIVRIFNTYGPRMSEVDGRVVSNFIVQALKNQPLTIYGEGQQTRSFCFASDLVDGMIRMMEWNKDESGGLSFPGPVNLGNPREMTIMELAELVLKLTGSSSKLDYRPLPSDDPTQRRPDISLAKEKLDWEPQVLLEDGLKETIAYFEGYLSKQGTLPAGKR